MNKFFFSFFLIFSFCQAQTIKKAFFIGNSYTAYNSLPTLVSDVSKSLHDTLQVTSYMPGGYTFKRHDTTTAVNNYINSQNWDYVILQEQSQLPSFPPNQVALDVYPYAESLCQKIYQNDSCTNIIFYMTWGRKNGDSQNCASYPPLCTYDGMQQRLRESYIEMAENNAAWVSPVGAAWKVVRDSFPNIELYNADQSHPSLIGSYLAACTIYSTMFQKSPVGAYFPTAIHPDTALIIQQTAAFVVLDSLPNWNIDTSNQATFQYNLLADGTLQILDIKNVDSHQWQFGDGNFSSDSIPTFQYQNFGTYILTHIVEKKCIKDTITTTISFMPTNIDNFQAAFKFYPNPVNNVLYLHDFQENKFITLVDILGVKTTLPIDGNHNSVDFSTVSEGIYIVHLASDKIFKLLVKH